MITSGRKSTEIENIVKLYTTLNNGSSHPLPNSPVQDDTIPDRSQLLAGKL